MAYWHPIYPVIETIDVSFYETMSGRLCNGLEPQGRVFDCGTTACSPSIIVSQNDELAKMKVLYLKDFKQKSTNPQYNLWVQLTFTKPKVVNEINCVDYGSTADKSTL